MHGWDTLSAYLAAVPGGLSQVMALAAEVDADMRAIAIVQTMRVVIVAVGLPAGLALFGLVGHAPRSFGGAFDRRFAIRRTRDSRGCFDRRRSRLLSAAVSRRADVRRDDHFGCAARQRSHSCGDAVVGDQLGDDRVRRGDRLALRQYAVAHVVALSSAPPSARSPWRSAIAAIFAAGLVGILSLPIAEVMIAYAPGAVDAMMLLALALHLDPVYVGAHHLVRIFFVSLIDAVCGASRRASARAKVAAPDRRRSRISA